MNPYSPLTQPLHETGKFHQQNKGMKDQNMTSISDSHTAVFHYSPANNNLSQIADEMVEILGLLQNRVRIRNIVSIKDEKLSFWLILEGMGEGIEDLLLEKLRGVGLEISRASSLELDFLQKSFPQGQKNGRQVLDPMGNELMAVTVVGGWSVTQPGMTRGVTRWMLRSGQVSHLFLDAVCDAATGLAYFDLTFVLAVGRGNCTVASDLAELLDDTLEVDTRRHRGAAVLNLLERLNPQKLSRRPRQAGCLGNIADLFLV